MHSGRGRGGGRVGPAMAHRVFEAGSGFHVGWRKNSGKVLIFVSQELSSSIIKAFILAGGAGRWAIALWGLDTFVIFPNFLTSLKSFGN